MLVKIDDNIGNSCEFFLTINIKSFSHDPLATISNEETFLQDFRDFSKLSLQNIYKIKINVSLVLDTK